MPYYTCYDYLYLKKIDKRQKNHLNFYFETGISVYHNITNNINIETYGR